MKRRWRRAHSAAEADAAAVAGVAPALHRLAVLLEAGIAPDRAWEHLAASGDSAPRRVDERRRAGEPLTGAIAAEPGAWREVATAWHVATTVGAPLARTLRGMAEALRDAEQARDDIRVALAEPTATARLVGWLPLVAVGLALLLGFDVVATVRHPVGATCLVVGALLMATAHLWTRRLVARARPVGGVPGMSAELLAIALSSGVSTRRAEEVLASVDVALAPADREVLGLSTAAGVPAVDLLRATADLERHRARIEGRMRAAQLTSRLLLPLGVCTLPAFLLIGVAPMLLSAMSSTSVPL
ncbi:MULTISPECIES: type II secretion system F family protein [Microbacterium]|uniref:type II secretion system F family protein n=1 Tax=Microbacterium TaxID=33882 RepID=UPI000E716FBD|nr:MULTISPECIES: type II secretion system F family protein [Microbacterium]RKE60337.1 tight adherence protein B [Microbacterium sp. AG238]WJM14791.1 type II secretion system F family protein [Microbacterium arborescens]